MLLFFPNNFKLKVVLNLSKYATNKNYNKLAAKKHFIALKAKVDKTDINKLINVPPSLNNLKTKEDELDAGELKTVSVDLKKLSDVLDIKSC